MRSTSAKVLAERKAATSYQPRVKSKCKIGKIKAELALSKDREDLAKAALVEKQKATGLADTLNQELAVIDEHIARLKDEVGMLQKKLLDAKARQRPLFCALKQRHHA